MNCTEFQSELPHIIDGGGGPEYDAHLNECEVCRDLVNDLRFIADQAKLLVSLEEPSPKVWSGISEKLKVEGLVKPAVVRGSMQRTGDPFK
jgi:predicted anti-sigma-YlaC factor YlaD